MSLNLFDDCVTADRQHEIYKHIKLPQYSAERLVLLNWSAGFHDRDGKFCQEFQTTFESCLWELYLHASFRRIGASVDFSHPSPDFVLKIPDHKLCTEATIAGPPHGGPPAYGYQLDEAPRDFNAFNAEAALRICNSFGSKLTKYRASYSKLAHSDNCPFVIAIGAYDRPFAHFADNRAVISALYGVYFDEEATIRLNSPQVIQYPVDAVRKTESASVPVGLFTHKGNHEVSAVIYSCLATWGKVRALADDSTANTIFTTMHPNPENIRPLIKVQKKSEYVEDLLDGLYVFHNPYASRPLLPEILAHPRIAQILPERDGSMKFEAPNDFLLLRYLWSV